MSEAPPIDLNCVLSEGSKLEPFFKKEEDYDAFRHRYIEEMRPILAAQGEARRKSEEESRKRLLR